MPAVDSRRSLAFGRWPASIPSLRRAQDIRLPWITSAGWLTWRTRPQIIVEQRAKSGFQGGGRGLPRTKIMLFSARRISVLRMLPHLEREKRCRVEA